jgi:hypothetical protein
MQQRRKDEGTAGMGMRRGLALCLGLAAACGSTSSDPDAPPASIDAGISPDAAVDAGAEGAPDAAPDAGVDESTPPTTFIGDNGAILEGATVDGAGPIDRREIEVESLDGSLGDLVLGRAYVSKSSPSSERTRTVVEVTNRGTRTYCDVAVSRIEYLGADGTVLADGSEIIWGSVRQIGGFLAMTCLLPGERAFLLDTVERPMSGVATIKVRTAGAVMATTATAAQLRPVRYTVTDNDVAITVENTGTRAARVTTAYVVYLDGDGAPLGWTIARAPADDDVAAGASVVMEDNTTLFLGASTDLYVRVMYIE